MTLLAPVMLVPDVVASPPQEARSSSTATSLPNRFLPYKFTDKITPFAVSAPPHFLDLDSGLLVLRSSTKIASMERKPDSGTVEQKPESASTRSPYTSGSTERQRLLFAMATPSGSEGGAVENGVNGMPRNGYDLDKIVAATVLVHPSIASRRADLDAAQSGVDAARWGFYPSPSVRSERANRGNVQDTTVVSLQQPLWAGGRLTATLDAASSRVSAAGFGIAEAQCNLAQRAASTYRSWFVAHGKAEAFAKGIALLESYAQTMQRRIDGGVSASVDLELVKSRLSQMKSDFTSARAAERAALSQLSQMLGTPLSVGNIIRQALPTARLAGFEQLVEEAVYSYPWLRRLDHEIETAEHEVGVKRSVLWPNLNLRAEHHRAKDEISGRTDDNRIMVTFDFSPGAGLSAGAGIDAATAKVSALRESREAAKRELVETISADYESYVASRAQLENLRQTLKASREILLSYDRMFVAGKRGWLDVMNAARELTQVETLVIEAEASLVISWFRLRLFRGDMPWLGGVES